LGRHARKAFAAIQLCLVRLVRHRTVYKATNKETKEVVALKKVNMCNEKEGVRRLPRRRHPAAAPLVVCSTAAEEPGV